MSGQWRRVTKEIYAKVCHKPKDSRLNVGLEMIVTLINIDSGMLTQTNLLLVLQILDSYYSYMVSVCSVAHNFAVCN